MVRFVIIFVVMFAMLGCDLSTPKSKMLPILNSMSDRYPALQIPSNFVPSPITADEKKALDIADVTHSLMGVDKEYVRKIQIEGLRNLNATFHNPNVADELKFVGPIPGYTPGMSMFEYSDQVIQTMIFELKDFPIVALKEYRLEVLTWAYTLQKLKQSCQDDTVEECKLLSHISDRYIYLREEIIKEIAKKAGNEMGL